MAIIFSRATLPVAVFTILFSLANLAAAEQVVLTEEGLKLHRESLVVDGHNDLPWTLRSNGDMSLTRFNLNNNQPRFHTDIPRLREGGMGAQFWSVYVPASSSSAHKTTLEQIDLVQRMVRKYPDAFAIALSTADIHSARAAGKIASMIGVEGGHSIENSLTKLQKLYDLGARYMTLTHSLTLDWADSATDTARNNGLTDFGRQVVLEMNRLGMLVDISHVSAKTMKDTLAITKAPIIASHSSAFAINSHVRNVPDDVLRLVAQNRGVIMVNFYSRYIVPNGTAEEARGDVYTLIDHIDHIVKVAGIDYVGLGSDYDGVPTLPAQLEDVSTYPYITQALLNRGYNAADIKKILGENLMRVFAEVEQIAKQSR